jgi:ribosomal protein S18 acetylase RimI-like enzyme
MEGLCLFGVVSALAYNYQTYRRILRTHARICQQSYLLYPPETTLSCPPLLSLVNVADPRIKEKCLDVLTKAFKSDPIFTFFVPHDDHRLSFIRRFFDSLLQISPGRCYQYDDFSAAMVWCRGNQEKISIPLPLFSPQVLKNALLLPYAKIIAPLLLVNEIERIQKKYLGNLDHFYYLMMIGVDPDLQGRGVGSLLLKYFLENHADAEGVACYLESSSEQSRRMYERHGFILLETAFASPNGPPSYSMLRPAKTRDPNVDSGNLLQSRKI